LDLVTAVIEYAQVGRGMIGRETICEA